VGKMSMLCVFYLFNKRSNSTKTPDNTMITVSGNISLKMPTSLHSPTILFACGASDMSKAMASNYCAFNNTLYWIRNATMISNTHIEFACEVDVLASYKNQILLTKAYIAYSTNGTLEITDNRIGMRNDFEKTVHSQTLSIYKSTQEQLDYVLTTTGYDGIATNYIMSNSQMSKLGSELNSTDFLDAVQQYFANPWDGIVNLTMTPIKLSEYTIERDVAVNNYVTAATGYVVNSYANAHQVVEFAIGNHTDFRDNSSCTTWLMLLPYVGVVPLDANILYNVNRLQIATYAEIVTGNVMYIIDATFGSDTQNPTPIATYSGNCNSTAPFSRASTNIGQGISSIASGLWGVGTLAAGAVTGGAGLVIGGAGAAINSLVQGTLSERVNTQTNGSLSSAIGRYVGNEIILLKLKKKTQMNPADITATLGNPTAKCDTIGNYTGYVQTSGASVSANATYEELQQINSLLDGGVYIE